MRKTADNSQLKDNCFMVRRLNQQNLFCGKPQNSNLVFKIHELPDMYIEIAGIII